MSNKFDNSINFLKKSTGIIGKIMGIADSINEIKDGILDNEESETESETESESDYESDSDNEQLEEYQDLEKVYIKEAVALNEAANLRIKESDTLEKLASVKATFIEITNINGLIKQKKEELDDAYFKKKFNLVADIANEIDRLKKKKQILEESHKYPNTDFDVKEQKDYEEYDNNNSDLNYFEDTEDSKNIDTEDSKNIDTEDTKNIDTEDTKNIDTEDTKKKDTEDTKNIDTEDTKKKDNEYLKKILEAKTKYLIKFSKSKISSNTLNINIKSIKSIDNYLIKKIDKNAFCKKIEGKENLKAKLYTDNYKKKFIIKDCIPLNNNKILFNINSEIKNNESTDGLIKLFI